nr:hypothetical protein [Candidatus Sigynarchaeota archaeon]
MPVVLLRLVQKIKSDKWGALDEIDKKYDAIENKLGYPPKKRYRSIAGPLNTDTIVIEREFKSMAVLEELQMKSWGSSEIQKLMQETLNIIEKQWMEIYIVWPIKV